MVAVAESLAAFVAQVSGCMSSGTSGLQSVGSLGDVLGNTAGKAPGGRLSDAGPSGRNSCRHSTMDEPAEVGVSADEVAKRVADILGGRLNDIHHEVYGMSARLGNVEEHVQRNRENERWIKLSLIHI